MMMKQAKKNLKQLSNKIKVYKQKKKYKKSNLYIYNKRIIDVMIVKHKITGTKINEDKKKEKFEQIL